MFIIYDNKSIAGTYFTAGLFKQMNIQSEIS
jgi:hypothetical protein